MIGELVIASEDAFQQKVLLSPLEVFCASTERVQLFLNTHDRHRQHPAWMVEYEDRSLLSSALTSWNEQAEIRMEGTDLLPFLKKPAVKLGIFLRNLAKYYIISLSSPVFLFSLSRYTSQFSLHSDSTDPPIPSTWLFTLFGYYSQGRRVIWKVTPDGDCMSLPLSLITPLSSLF